MRAEMQRCDDILPMMQMDFVPAEPGASTPV